MTTNAAAVVAVSSLRAVEEGETSGTGTCSRCIAEMDQLMNDPEFDGKGGDMEWVCDHGPVTTTPRPGADAGTADLATLERVARVNGYWSYIEPWAKRVAARLSAPSPARSAE